MKGGIMSNVIRPKSFAHVVYRTYRYQEMLDWYVTVFNGWVQHETPLIAFITYDDEHHRVGLINLSHVKGASDIRTPRGQPGMDHVAYGYSSLTELLTRYEQLKEKGVLPYWCIHHGTTISLYYADPDGNQMEFQVDSYSTAEEASDFMHGLGFAINPVGVEFDPDAMLARLRASESERSLLPRTTHLPVSEVRGSIMG
jgi:catechol-2,3-dioxygenase